MSAWHDEDYVEIQSEVSYAPPTLERRAPCLRALALDELLAMDIKPRAMLLRPILPEKGLAMVYGPRGTGKTHVALAIGHAVSSGGSVFGWRAPEPRNVLYVDGEMPLVTLRERLAAIDAGSSAMVPPGAFRILAADHVEDGIPNLATKQGQAAIEPLLDDVSLLIIDNVSTLASWGRDNDAESWTPFQEFLLRLRRRGIAVLFVHHAGKGGQQRGTSRREDVLDTVIALRRPQDYSPTEGARFEVHIEKARGALGDDVKPFEARLDVRDEAATWSVRDIADADLDRVIALANEGKSIRDIAEATRISKSTVQRLKVRAEGDGLLGNGRRQ
jgi:putative DNA primase/helicase